MQLLISAVSLSLLGLMLSGCSHTPTHHEQVQAGLAALFKNPFAENQSIPVLYATNRAQLNGAGECGGGTYAVTSDGSLHFGACLVHVPRKRPVGSIADSTDPAADADRYLRPLRHDVLTQEQLSDLLRRGGNNGGILVFVHGFNVNFEEAALRIAQLSYDLKFQGAILLLSWPAGAASGFLSSTLVSRTYDLNRATAAESTGFMQSMFEFLQPLAEDGIPVSVSVHSMGHQVVLPALARLSDQVQKPLFQELILNAPDFPTEEFQLIAEKLTRVSRRVTVYCSPKDNAILASEKYNSTRRIGSCERVPGVDVINVGEIDAPTLGFAGLGHGYYSSRPILTDVFQLLLGMKAENRLFIRISETEGRENYFLRP